jgi:hypothetical protein
MRRRPVLPEAAASAKQLNNKQLNQTASSVSSDDEEDSFGNLQLEVGRRMIVHLRF